MSAVETFHHRLMTEWLPAYCSHPKKVRHHVSGFKPPDRAALHESDAEWFLYALDNDVVHHADGYFHSARNGSVEKLFNTGRKNITPRPLWFSNEPFITIAALGRLHNEFHWPREQLGLQSDPPYAFDLMCYDKDGRALTAGEVKNTERDIERMLTHMHDYARNRFSEDGLKQGEKNSYRKVKGIRQNQPQYFVAIGPNEYTRVFQVKWSDIPDAFTLEECETDVLNYSNFG